LRRLVIPVRTKFIEPRDVANSPVPLYHELKEPDVDQEGPGKRPRRKEAGEEGKGSA
jgi:hypothetical protein